MTTLYIAASHQSEGIPMSHNLGDVVTSIKVAWLWHETEKPSKVILSLCEDEQWNILWSRFIRESNALVVFDKKVKHKSEMYFIFDERRRKREVHGMKFDCYKELYCRMEGGMRQTVLCGHETGIGRKNIFAYFYYGQETHIPDPEGIDDFGTDVIDFANFQRESKVLVAPHAKCQGNHVFTFGFWSRVVRRLIDAGISITLNDSINRIGIPELHPKMSAPSDISNYVARHALVVCGNTGIGWVAGATGTPLFGMEPPHFDLMDFRYKECGVRSLKRLFSEPDADAVADAVIEFMRGQYVDAAPDAAAEIPIPVTAPRKLQNMVEWLQKAPPGPVVEFGVFKGGSLIYLASRFPDRHFCGVDTFDGSPSPGCYDNFHKAGDFRADFESVKRSCAHLTNVTLLKGSILQSADFLLADFVLAHVDVDFYQSTKDALEVVRDKMAPISRIYCDDCFLDTCHGATIAMCEVSASIGRPLKIDHGLHGAICFGE